MKLRLISGILLATVCFACQRGRPARKELPPTLTTLPEIEATVTPVPSRALASQSNRSAQSAQSADYLFYSTDTTVLIDGLRRDLLVLAIPDPTHDAAIGDLISSGQSLAPYLLTELHHQHKSGIIIDLRVEASTPTIRQDYLVSSNTLNESSLPVIFLFDRTSANRANLFTKYLEAFPNISWSIVNDRPRYQNDCFKVIHPSY
jgi:hypothetical protein